MFILIQILLRMGSNAIYCVASYVEKLWRFDVKTKGLNFDEKYAIIAHCQTNVGNK